MAEDWFDAELHVDKQSIAIVYYEGKEPKAAFIVPLDQAERLAKKILQLVKTWKR